ncbi:MAG: hypothetical protein L3J74_13205 [Bacteroidales bacterium]|nr:hypothetical protein [Bacteroidales bacterium]
MDIRYLLLLVLLLQFAQTNSLTAQSVKLSREHIVVEKVPQEKINEFRSQNDFKYIKKAQPGDSLWDIFWFYIFKFLEYIFSDEGATPYIRNTIFTLLIILIAKRLFRADFSGIFGKNIKLARSNFNYTDEDIRGVNFDLEINKAVNERNYRLAIRFLYLKLLHLLNQNELINWLPEKTNRKYLQELNDKAVYNNFKNLSKIYEYSWYGHFEPNKHQFDHFFDEFKQSFSLIDKNT